MGFRDFGSWEDGVLVLPTSCYDASMIKRDGLPEECENATNRLEYCRLGDGVFVGFGEHKLPYVFPHKEIVY